MGKTMREYYNEFNPDAAAWLRDLMRAKLIPEGEVDERSIKEVRPDDLKGFQRCHFFAGIGLWTYALRLSGFPSDRPVWTGSCPCQPFSQAGKQKGEEDERHLWPVWYGLIRECRPPVVFGEQVAAAIGKGWLDLVQSDLESSGYAVGKAVLGAASVGAPHIRQRLFFVADSRILEPRRIPSLGREEVSETGSGSETEQLGYAESDGRGTLDREPRKSLRQEEPSGGSGISVKLGNNNNTGLQGWGGEPGERGSQFTAGETGSVSGFWRDAKWIWCRDEKHRPIEPGTSPLAHGLPRGMGNLPDDVQRLAELAGLSKQSLKNAKHYRKSSLHGYGNAIVPQVASEFIRAYLEASV
jgi:DNA (cytosine-5)-methyltransferase 1